MMMAMAEWTPSVLLSLGARAASGPINMIVTNVPGPQIPLHLLGARLIEAFPLVPLLENTGLGVALFSYNGKLCWGFNADYELIPDLRVFVRAVDSSFRELAGAAGVKLDEGSDRAEDKAGSDLNVASPRGHAGSATGRTGPNGPSVGAGRQGPVD